MRLYDLDKAIDKLLSDDKIQVEFIGEDGGWTARISKKEWRESSQRFFYWEIACITARTFLEVLDFATGQIQKYNEI